MSLCEDICGNSLLLILASSEIRGLHRNYRPHWLSNPKTGKNLEYDFYLERSRIGIEIQGPHHYECADQIRRDETKKILSKKFGVPLFELSTIQIGPIFLYKKLLNFSLKNKEHRVQLKKFSRKWADVERGEVSSYRNLIKKRFGKRAESVRSPKCIKQEKEKKAKERFLNYITTTNVEYQGRMVRCLYEGLTNTKKNVILRILGTDKFIFVRKNKFLKNLGV